MFRYLKDLSFTRLNQLLELVDLLKLLALFQIKGDYLLALLVYGLLVIKPKLEGFIVQPCPSG